MRPATFNLRQHSLIRGNVLVLISLFSALLISGFPNERATLLLLIPTVVALIGTGETIRCIPGTRWNLYKGGVILCIYMDLMALVLILFLLLYPYQHWLGASS